jgi:hypothetical protein
VHRAIVKKAAEGYCNTHFSGLLFPAVDGAIVKKSDKRLLQHPVLRSSSSFICSHSMIKNFTYGPRVF